ncbi:hypothetical protein FE257_011016 [Aspergillus nanangensis]|uniref:Uncharacterized protein n=1 Tax=Aspergillus nanangensis TaxID=2582783 RepID=A0AAD4CJF9_ASPNN|nr:hypothetical protein FE257_011016 [Aspergillus nanangensis]
MPKKGGKTKNKGKGKGGAGAAAAAKKATDVQNTSTPAQEVEEIAAKSEGESTNVTTEAGDTVTAAPTTTVSDTTAAAPASSVAEAKDTVKEVANKTSAEQDSKTEALGSGNAATTTAATTAEPATPAAVTSLPERTKVPGLGSAPVDTSDAHVKRPHETTATTEEDTLPHKMPKVDETGSLAKGAETVDKAGVQPQIVPGLGAEANEKVGSVLNVPGLPANDKAVSGTDAVASTSKPAGAASGTAAAPVASATAADKTAPAKETAPVAKETVVPTVIEPSTGPSAPAAPVSAAPAEKSAPTGPATQSSTAAPSTGATQATPAAAAAAAAPLAATGVAAPSAPKEPETKVPSSIRDETADKSKLEQATADLKQKAQGAVDKAESTVKDKLPGESQPKTTQEQQSPAAAAAAAAASKKPEDIAKPQEIKKPEEAKTREPQAGQETQNETAAPQEGQTAGDKAQDAVKTEADKAEKRKSGGFWSKVKRMFK